MLKKIAFAFIAALVLVNASVAFTKSAANAQAYNGTTEHQQSQENQERAQHNRGS